MIPVWPTSDAGDIAPAALTNVFKLSAPYFDMCASWEVKSVACQGRARARAGEASCSRIDAVQGSLYRAPLLYV